jgi:hypothetical protein
MHPRISDLSWQPTPLSPPRDSGPRGIVINDMLVRTTPTGQFPPQTILNPSRVSIQATLFYSAQLRDDHFCSQLDDFMRMYR